jgi:broad specificity phosphatase PhoE
VTEILLTRHAKSYANARDVAFGNQESPINEKGIEQAKALNSVFKEEHGITPELYSRAVLSSKYVRPQETARLAGFNIVDTSPLINEVTVSPDMLARGKIIQKHREERWVPSELQDRAENFIEHVRSGELDYQVFFTHGFFIAAVLDRLSAECEASCEAAPYVFDEERGYIPRLATIIPVIV